MEKRREGALVVGTADVAWAVEAVVAAGSAALEPVKPASVRGAGGRVVRVLANGGREKLWCRDDEGGWPEGAGAAA